MSDNKIIYFLICLASLVLTACQPGESNVESGLRQGILHLGNGTEVQGVDPHVVTGVPEHHVIQAIFEGLVVKNPYTLEPEPASAERWEISEDGRVYRFYLREDANWSNGDPVTAHDYVWAWRRALIPEMGNLYSYMMYPVLNAEAFNTGKIDDFDPGWY